MDGRQSSLLKKWGTGFAIAILGFLAGVAFLAVTASCRADMGGPCGGGAGYMTFVFPPANFFVGFATGYGFGSKDWLKGLKTVSWIVLGSEAALSLLISLPGLLL